MEKEKKEELSLLTSKDELMNKIMNSSDPVELKNIIDLFNLSIKKKNLIRVGKLDEVQDKAIEQLELRLKEKGDEFSNKDLLDYFKTIQDSLTKQNTPIDNIPQIQINQQIVVNDNGNGSGDNYDKYKVIDFVKSILQSRDENPEEIIDAEIKEKNKDGKEKV